MKTRIFIFTLAAALMSMLAYSGIGFAAKGGIQGPPGDSGEPPDLGDIIVLYRDAWGLPILTADLCQQPIGLPSDTCPLDCEEGELCLVPVDSNCAVLVGYESCTQEVDFGRTSVIRSPVSVIEQSLEEAVSKLATAQCTTLDPAGRLVNTSEIDDVVLSATIDSPLENLAIYWQLMQTGYLGAEAYPLVLPDENALNMAARGLGAAADKTGKVTVDQVVYINEIMGLTDESVKTYLPKICMNVREEVQGTIQTVRKCFLNYGGEHPDHISIGGTIANYQYNRANNFAALPAPAYIPESGHMDGWFEFLALYSAGTPDLFYIYQGPIMEAAFLSEPGFMNGNIGGFTQAADDAREVIEFTHDRPMPLGYETPVPLCDVPDESTIYDVSISGDSGLQVPKRMVADAEEGREIIVTVNNAGPDTATGYVTVVGVDADGMTVFEETNPFAIDADGIYSNSNDPWLFSLDYATTVTWTATAVPDCSECDLNGGNNSVEETTTVKTTGGGGGGGRRQ